MVVRRSTKVALGFASLLAGAVLVLLVPHGAAFGYPQTAISKPDAGGYVYLTSDDGIKGQPVYNWLEISTTGTKVTWATPGTGGVDGYISQSAAPVVMPFPFKFYSSSVTSYYVCSGGVVAFPIANYYCPGNYGPTSYNYYFAAGAYNEFPGAYYYTSNAIAAHYGPLWANSAAGSAVYHETVGTSPNRVEVIEWSKLQYCVKDTPPANSAGACTTGAGELTFEVQIHEDGRIEVHYQKMDLTGVPANETYGTTLYYGYGATQQGLMAAGNQYCYGAYNKSSNPSGCYGLSYRMSCETAYTGPPCNTADDFPSQLGYCYNTCDTFGTPSPQWAILYYKNQPPTGSNVQVTVVEDTPTPIAAPGNDPEGRAIFTSYKGQSLIQSAPRHGTAVAYPPTATADGYYLYTPDPEYNGMDSFSVLVSDGFTVNPAVYTIDIQVTPTNDLPVGTDDVVEVFDYPSVTDVAAPGLLGNDHDAEVQYQEGPNGKCYGGYPMHPLPCTGITQSLSVVGNSAAANAQTLIVNADGSMRYAAAPGATTDSFTYTVCDDNDVSTQQATNPPTNPPVRGCAANVKVDVFVRDIRLAAKADQYKGTEDQTLTVVAASGVLANDPGKANQTGITLVEAATQPWGSLAIDPYGALTYVPAQDFCGLAEWTYRLEASLPSSSGMGNRVPVRFDVTCVDDAPVWSGNHTKYIAKPGLTVSDRQWGANRDILQSICCKVAPVVPFKVPTSVLAGPCTPAGQDECSVQNLRIAITNDNPRIFAPAGQPTLELYTEGRFATAKYHTSFYPIYAFLNFTADTLESGIAHLQACLIDDGKDTGLAAGPGSVDRKCIAFTVEVPGPPETHPDTYEAFGGRTLYTTPRTGVLGNDFDYAQRPSKAVAQPGEVGVNLKAFLASSPAHAQSFGFNDDGTFAYTPVDGYDGPDGFTYGADDGNYSTLQPEKVTFHVHATNEPGASFSYLPSDPFVTQEVTFTDQSGVIDGQIVAWAWDFGDGSSANEANPKHTFNAPGEYVVRLTVSDQKGDTATATQAVRVRGDGANQEYMAGGHDLPKAIAGDDFATDEGSLVMLAGTAQPLASVATWNWHQVSGPVVRLSSVHAQAPTFTAPMLVGGQSEALVFALTVTDGEALSAPDNVTVTVLSTNRAPDIVAVAPAKAASGTLVVLDATGTSDSDGDAVSYEWVQVAGPTVPLTGGRTARATYTAPEALTPLTMAFELHATDGKHADRVDTVQTIVSTDGTADLVIEVAAVGADGASYTFSGGDAQSVWDFGDGTTARGAVVQHAFQPGQTYNVTLTSLGQTRTVQVTAQQSPLGDQASSKTPGLAAGVLLVALGALAVALRRRN